MKRTSLAILGLVLAASPALAQKAKYTRNSEVKVDVKLSDRTKPIQPKPVDPKSQQPTLTADDVLSIEGLVGNIRSEQEQILADLIQNTPDREVDEKSNYYFMLGELYAKQQRFWRLKAAELMIARDTAKNAAQKNKLNADALAAANRAKDYLLKAVKTYKGLTDNEKFRNYPKMDMALFYYGYTLQGGKYMKEARAVYDQLLKNYPKSKYVPEAHLAFADYYFESNQLADAEARYKQVLKFPQSSAYQYAKYKLGWIHLNLSRFQEALEAFFEVAQATKNDKKQEILNRASKKDFVRAYSEIGKADKAYPAFQRVDQKYAFDMLGILADLYLGQGKSDKAIFVFQEMMKLQPGNKNVCLWQYNIAHAMLSMVGASNADKVKEIENLVRLWMALKGKPVLPKTEAQECHDNAAAMSGELARAYHSESAKTKNSETLAYAERLYKVYLDGFPDAADYAQTQYFYAELIWSRAENEKNARLQTELWENAAVAFTDVVKKGKVEPKLVKEAAYAAVLGWKNALNVDPRVKQQADKVDNIDKEYDKVPPPKPIPPREEKMLAAFDIYINYIKDPKDDELVGMKFLKANIYRRYNHFDKAIPLFMDILDKHRSHETAEYSANLLLDTYNRMQRYDEMLALVDKLDGDKKFLEGKDDLAATMSKIKAQSMRKKAEKLEKQAKESKDFSQYVACGQAYLEIYNRNPTDDANDEVLYNALVCYQEGKSIGAAIQMFGLMKQYYPKSKHMPKAVGRIGKAYGDIAFYEQAADKLEEYAKNYGGEKDAFQALSEAVFYRKGIGQDDKAKANTEYFIRQYGPGTKWNKVKEASDAMFSLTSVYEKQNDGDATIRHLRNYIAKFPADKGGADRIVIAYAKIGQILWRQSCPRPLVDGSCVIIARERALASKKAKKVKKGANEQPTQCGPESKIKLTVIKRDEGKKRAALAAFAEAQKAFEKTNGKTGGDEGGARYYYAQSKFAQADVDFEAYLDLKFPAGLNFDPDPAKKAIKEKSLKRFDDWIKERTKVGGSATAKYEAILNIKDAATSIAAAARLAQISQNLSDALFSAAIPQDVRTGEFADEKVEAFCDKMTEVAEPLDLRALNGYSVCLTKSTELGWFSEWSKMCERELGQIKPEEFPTSHELRGEPTRVAPVTDVEPAIGKLE
jgi:outer membrane protein assembly factor BamD (BamD/ComL family)